MERLNKHINQSLRKSNIRTRPNASPGAWMCFLLPTAIIQSVIRHSNECTTIYKLNALLSVGLILSSFVFLLQCYRLKDIERIQSLYVIPGALTASLFYVFVSPDYVFSFLSGISSGILYYKLFLFIIREAACSFTIGEASIVSQAITLFIYSTILNVNQAIHHVPYKNIEIITLLLQLGLSCIGCICLITYYIKLFRRPFWFYTLFAVQIHLFLIIPSIVLMKINVFRWLFDFLFDNATRLRILSYWILLSVAASFTIYQQIRYARKATTIRRKIFHLFAVLTFLPGMIYECHLLYFASGICLAFLILFDLLRKLAMPPLGQHLQNGFVLFRDEKDADLSLTPIYLLIGCAVPFWLHPTPCDLTDSVGFYMTTMLSGLLTVGVGDTSASVIGKLIGRYKWPGTQKTVEGTLACVCSQICCVFLLIYTGYIVRGHLQIIKCGCAILVTSLIEAKSTQIDNLSLPLIMYLIVV